MKKKTKKETKWIEEFNFQFVLKDYHTGVEEWNTMSMNDLPPKIIKAFILSTLQEYAGEVCGICDDMDLMLAIAQSTTEDTPHKEIVEMLGGTRDNLKQILHKLNTTYGLKGEK